MGFVINQPVISPGFDEILAEVGLDDEARTYKELGRDIAVLKGGPVEKGRGFLLHSQDFASRSSTRVADVASLTATLDSLKVAVGETPPRNMLMLLGYSGWGPGQLEREITENGWLTVRATENLVFECPTDDLYDRALAEIGVSESALSGIAGHA